MLLLISPGSGVLPPHAQESAGSLGFRVASRERAPQTQTRQFRTGLGMTRPLLLILLAHGAAAISLDDILRVERTLTFPGWRRLARETRHDYILYPYSASDGLETMKLKQRMHDGDRSHPSIVALDETKASLSYPGWRSDAAKAEMVWGFNNIFCRHLPRDIDKSVARMKRKQEYHEALPPNVLTAVCRSGASQVNRLLDLSGERFGYWPTFTLCLTATSTLVAFPLTCALVMPYSP